MKPPFSMVTETELERWRYRTWATKEPETIAWIDTFQPGELFFDVGANVGVYSLYAASRGIHVVAVEPHLRNYNSLCINQKLNGFRCFLPLRYAIGEKSGIVSFEVPDERAGATGGQATRKADSYFEVVFQVTLDALATLMEKPPDHIKIDIDGQEDAVIRGMEGLLNYQKFKTCLVEVDPVNRDFITGRFTRAGYVLHPLNQMTPHSRERREKEGIAVENIIFTRDT